MEATVRASDTVGRIGGDEFVVLLSELAGPEEAMLVAEKIRRALAAPYEINGKTLTIACSAGVVLYPDHGGNDIELMARADAAMYAAKIGGRNQVRLYQPEKP